MADEQLRRRLASMHLEVAATALACFAAEVRNAAGAMPRKTVHQFDFMIMKLEEAIAKARLDLEA